MPEAKTNCAGFGKFDHTENLDADTLTSMVELNCTAAVAMISYSLPYIGRKGRILPKSIVMKVWMASQKLDGTPNIR